MIYRILVDRDEYEDFLDTLVPKDEFAAELLGNLKAAAAVVAKPRLRGASYSALAAVMDKHGVRRPRIKHRRARFYFTELGWFKAGRRVAAEAKRLGHVVKVIRRKAPRRSQIVYRDELQLAILPETPETRRRQPG